MDFGLFPSRSGTISYSPVPPVPDPAVSPVRLSGLKILFPKAIQVAVRQYIWYTLYIIGFAYLIIPWNRLLVGRFFGF